MSSPLTLARDLEQKPEAQQQSASETLEIAFNKHEGSVRVESNGNEKRISVAILDHDQKLSLAMSQRMKGVLRMVNQMWLTAVLAPVLLIASNVGILWRQGRQILNNYTSIREQKDAPEELNARTRGVRYQEDNQGHFLVLPEGVKAGANWTFDNGRKNGIRLMQEQNSITKSGKQLLSTLEQLQWDYSKRLDEWENAFAEWRTMSGFMQRENAAPSERVASLSRQVQSLSEQLCRLSQG